VRTRCGTRSAGLGVVTRFIYTVVLWYLFELTEVTLAAYMADVAEVQLGNRLIPACVY
jgi:hypothetical protein